MTNWFKSTNNFFYKSYNNLSSETGVSLFSFSFENQEKTTL